MNGNATWTWHGGGLAAARSRFGDGPWIDLSTGINPRGWDGAACDAIDWRRLPEQRDLAALEAAAADAFGVDPLHVCAVPGTEIGLRLIGRLIGGGARILGPSYRTHGEMMPATSIALEDVERHDGHLIIANPNNPDGRLLPRERLAAMLDGRRADAWLLLDEAFVDCDPSRSIADLVNDARRLIVFRSFGKFFGLAGVRLGFVVAPVLMARELRALLGAWPVSAAALSIGTAAYRDTRWADAMRTRLRDQAIALDAVLRRAGHEPIGHCPLFRLIAVADGMKLFERLARQHILTRPFAENPRWLRLGLPADDGQLGRLAAALALASAPADG